MRAIFPVTPRAATFGPMLELGWGTPAIVNVRLGLIVQLDNVLPPGNAPVSFTRLVLVGQLRVQMLPEETGTPPLLKLLVDILGFYDSDSKRLGFVARLRDSKVAELTLSGMLVVQADFGADPSFVLAAGGFHPRFKDIPAGTPAPIDRLGVGFNIGIVKITIEGYFAVAAVDRAGRGDAAGQGEDRAGVDRWLARASTPSSTSSRASTSRSTCKAGVSVKFKGHNLASVDFKGTLSGPGLWRVTGTVTFSILFWDVDKSFDECIGSAPETPADRDRRRRLVRSALTDPGNWTAQLPAAGEPDGHASARIDGGDAACWRTRWAGSTVIAAGRTRSDFDLQQFRQRPDQRRQPLRHHAGRASGAARSPTPNRRPPSPSLARTSWT